MRVYVKLFIFAALFPLTLISCSKNDESPTSSSLQPTQETVKSQMEGVKALVIAPALNLHTKPKEGSATVSAEPLVYQCAEVKVEEESGDWLLVTTTLGNSGYLRLHGEEGETCLIPLSEYEDAYTTALTCLPIAELEKGTLGDDVLLVGIWGEALINGRAKSWVFHYYSPATKEYLRIEVAKGKIVDKEMGDVALTASTSGAIFPPIAGGTTFEVPAGIIDSDLAAKVALEKGAQKFLEQREKYYTLVICCYYIGYPSYPGGAAVRWHVAFDAFALGGAHAFVIGPGDTTFYGRYDHYPRI